LELSRRLENKALKARIVEIIDGRKNIEVIKNPSSDRNKKKQI
jgi:hypothetical protein